MDKDKIIKNILAEWAMRSPDGLAGGHDTPENKQVLNEIFEELGITEAPQDNIEIQKFSVQDLVENKGFTSDIAKLIVKSLKYIPVPDQETFINEYYDNMSLADACEFLTKNLSKYRSFLDYLDDEVRIRASTRVGRGEYALVLFVKGCTTGGQDSGDLVLDNGETADVKEIDGETFRATQASFGSGGFEKVPFVRAINQLISFCNRNPESIEILKNLVDEAEVKNQGTAKDKTSTLNFLDALSWNKINCGSTRGLLKIMGHLQGLKPEELPTAGTGDKVEFDFDDKEATFAMDDLPQQEKAKLSDPNIEPRTPVTVQISPISDKANQLILPQLKKLQLFALPAGGIEEVFTNKNIATSMFDAMEHYSGGIVFYDIKKGFDYESDLENMKKPFGFYAYAQTGPVFKRLK